MMNPPRLRRSRAAITGAILGSLAIGALPAANVAWAAVEEITFNGFTEGDIVRDQYMFLGLRLPADPAGGPFIDDGGGLAFFLDTPPGLLSLSPFAGLGGPNQVHGSVGTYVFDFVDPTNPFVPSFTDRVDVVVVLVDKGDTVLTAYDAAGGVIGTSALSLGDFDFFPHVLSVSGAGIRRATLATPQVQPTIGCLVDTLLFESPAVIPPRTIQIDIRPGARRNTIRLTSPTTVPVAILSSPGFEPSRLDPGKILFQRAAAVSFSLVDRNHDRIPDLTLDFRIGDLVGLDATSTAATLTAVDADGTPLVGTDAVEVQSGQGGRPFGASPIVPREPGGLNL